MPLSVHQSKEMIINDKDGESGDLLGLRLADRSTLLLTLRVEHWSGERTYRHFVIEPQHFTPSISAYVKERIGYSLQYGYARYFKEAYEERDAEDESLGLYDWLSKEVTKQFSISGIEIDKVPTGQCSWPRSTSPTDRKVWSAPAPIVAIEPVSDPWTGVIFAAQMSALR